MGRDAGNGDRLPLPTALAGFLPPSPGSIDAGVTPLVSGLKSLRAHQWPQLAQSRNAPMSRWGLALPSAETSEPGRAGRDLDTVNNEFFTNALFVDAVSEIAITARQAVRLDLQTVQRHPAPSARSRSCDSAFVVTAVTAIGNELLAVAAAEKNSTTGMLPALTVPHRAPAIQARLL